MSYIYTSKDPEALIEVSVQLENDKAYLKRVLRGVTAICVLLVICNLGQIAALIANSEKAAPMTQSHPNSAYGGGSVDQAAETWDFREGGIVGRIWFQNSAFIKLYEPLEKDYDQHGIVGYVSYDEVITGWHKVLDQQEPGALNSTTQVQKSEDAHGNIEFSGVEIHWEKDYDNAPGAVKCSDNRAFCFVHMRLHSSD